MTITNYTAVAASATTSNTNSDVADTKITNEHGYNQNASSGSVGSEETPEATRSLTDEEHDNDDVDEDLNVHVNLDNIMKNQSVDMTENTEPASHSSSCPEDTASEGTACKSSKTDSATGSSAAPEKKGEYEETMNGQASSCNSNNDNSSPPKFYRLNAFIRESQSSDDEDHDNANATREFGPPDVEAELRRELGYEDTEAQTNPVRGREGCGSEAVPMNASEKNGSKRRGVRFQNVCIREYEVTIGDNPYCSYGVPICLDWNYGEEEVIPLDFFEASHKRRRTARKMLLNSFQRRDMLWRSGYPLEDIEKAIKVNEREKLRRSFTLYFLPVFQLQEAIYFGAEKVFKGKKNDARRVEEMVQKQQEAELQKLQNSNPDMEIGGMNVVKEYDNFEYEKPRRRLSFRSQASRSTGGGSNIMGTGSGEGSLRQREWSVLSGSSIASQLMHDRDDPYAASHNSRFKEYAVRVDRGQHDKATEIILCNFQRPHMRAFHAAWFSFFIAFFMWFAVTPLLGEIKDTLGLSKEDVWTSSLCGAVGTIIMRIIMGPACDKFGARICMAFILAAAAIPCALTGLVQTSQGLSSVRAFVGLAGASFVACQYWTSQMFTREVAGTANALVAGWGNLGGGVTQIVMGSALFPLFKLFFSGADDSEEEEGIQEQSSELAWRAVFVIPAVVSLITAYIIVAYCDDSPKGDYRERVRQQEIMVVSPMASLCAACHNWNVWILLVQYACCFGVEVTMTNATALYFRDEFGQSTVSAAAIASVFGFMNLFARGFGGFGSDLFNAKYGMRGRVTWQTITLFLEGIAVIIFGFADTLAGSIIALIFLSLMVQCAEGSTFGIVPYVDRRYTGSVVGWVGAGGTIGGSCFSVLFIHFDYEKAFLFMGVLASSSAVLSCLMNIRKLTKNSAAIVNEDSEEKGQHHHHHEAIGMTKSTAITFAQLDGHEPGEDAIIPNRS